MELAAARLARMVGYTHAGTVEYLFVQETGQFFFLELNPSHAFSHILTPSQETGQFFFLELNPRLQVEHPVTEGITGTNLPALQLIVAMDISLRALPPDHSVAKFLVDPDAPDAYVDPFSRVEGHVVAVRLTAENASDGWKPTVGRVSEASFQSSPAWWGWGGVG